MYGRKARPQPGELACMAAGSASSQEDCMYDRKVDFQPGGLVCMATKANGAVSLIVPAK